MRRWLIPLIAAIACCSATLCVRWRGRSAIDTLTFEGALATLQDPKAPPHRRRAAAGVLVLHMRMAVRALREDAEMERATDLLLGQLADMIRAPR